jgi:transposase
MIKNNIRAILDREGIRHPSGQPGWNRRARTRLTEMSAAWPAADRTDLWRGMLGAELKALDHVRSLIGEVEAELERRAAADDRVALLRTIPGVGPRLAETVVAVIDDPKRFKNGKQVSAYAGLVPRQFESGTVSRQGRITRTGNPLLRSLLVEVAWLMRRHNGWLREVFERIRRGSKTRSKIAAVATARRLLVICWAMLRDGKAWRPPMTS